MNVLSAVHTNFSDDCTIRCNSGFCSETSLNSLKVGAHFQSCTNICHYVALKPSTLPAFLESRHDDDDGCDNKVIAHAFHFWTIDF